MNPGPLINVPQRFSYSILQQKMRQSTLSHWNDSLCCLKLCFQRPLTCYRNDFLLAQRLPEDLGQPNKMLTEVCHAR